MCSATGVRGLDAVLCGGFPTGRTTIVTGGPGSGKTVLAIQYLIAGATLYDEPGLLISFEESPKALERNWEGMSWSLEGVLDKSVFILDGRVAPDAIETGTFDLGGLIAVLSSRVKKLGIKRLAIDGIDALFAQGENAPNRRREILRVLSWLGESNITALLTMKAEHGWEGVPPDFGFADFAADGVLQLRSTIIDALLRRTLRVLKLRGASFLAGDHPYTISQRGFTVLNGGTRTSIATTNSLSTRLSTGVERLDRMLDGGYRSGTITLISGLPGTSKTTLGATFLWAGCVAGERVQFVGFDEPAEQMIFDARSVGIDLREYVDSGLLCAESFIAGGAIGDEHYLAIEALIDANRPTRIVIDPVSALVKSGGPELADTVIERLAILFKSRGITAILTAVSDSNVGEIESTSMRVSTVADNWIHLSFAAKNGERNRTLTVIKARGTAHSNQFREVILSGAGVTLADVYAAGGDVLLGTARLRREQEALAEEERSHQSSALELGVLDQEREALNKSLDDLRHRLAQNEQNRDSIVLRTAVIGDVTVADAAAVRVARFGDPRDALSNGSESN
jgi:circadian clock protein KaiC